MTVCIAAICNDNMVLGASDRMITTGVAGSIGFEPNLPKVWTLTNSIAVMVADDILLHTEVFDKVKRPVLERIIKEPDNWWKVEDVADLYSRFYVQVKSMRAEREVLLPFHLSLEEFINRQKEMSPDFVMNIKEKLDKFKTSNISSIVTGVDADGPHIFEVNNEKVSCCDQIGFAVIGIGYLHAAPHLMFSGHVRKSPITRTLIVTHQAKKKSEVAPGVGRGTDMFMIGPKLGSFTPVSEAIVKQLDEIYDTTAKRAEDVYKKGERTFEKYLKSLVIEKTEAQKPTDTKDIVPPKSGEPG